MKGWGHWVHQGWEYVHLCVFVGECANVCLCVCFVACSWMVCVCAGSCVCVHKCLSMWVREFVCVHACVRECVFGIAHCPFQPNEELSGCHKTTPISPLDHLGCYLTKDIYFIQTCTGPIMHCNLQTGFSQRCYNILTGKRTPKGGSSSLREIWWLNGLSLDHATWHIHSLYLVIFLCWTISLALKHTLIKSGHPTPPYLSN